MVEHGSIAAAVRRLADPEWLRSSNYQQQRGQVDLSYHHPHLREFVRVVSHRLRKLHIPVYVAALDAMSAQGSPHSFGLGVDLVHGVGGYNLTAKEWAVIAHVATEVIGSTGLEVCQGERNAEWVVVGWRAYVRDFPRWQDFWLRVEAGEFVRPRVPLLRG